MPTTHGVWVWCSQGFKIKKHAHCRKNVLPLQLCSVRVHVHARTVRPGRPDQQGPEVGALTRRLGQGDKFERVVVNAAGESSAVVPEKKPSIPGTGTCA